MKKWIKHEYHINDLIMDTLLRNLEYKKSNQIQVHRVYTELGLEARKKCDELVEV
ncbi:hypothetical protein [Kriegella aquimaris]|uniref:Uncharacterized protein n=1 Tax=Kriegella aquimaris TaxID=192904 RepID=A0A1G9WPD7_9FLAO|nr:hypothetical protein [Kriegella aquimaris]SDM86444.1 hypothetical protein SAMN04488514_1168 [Kriegella aquimaris]